VTVTFKLPGAEDTIVRSRLNPTERTVGTNLNLNIALVRLVAPGRAVAVVTLETTPPVTREFSMEIAFEPPVAVSAPE